MLWRSLRSLAPLSAVFMDGARVELTYPRHREVRAWPSFELLDRAVTEPAGDRAGAAVAPLVGELGGQVENVAAGPGGLAAALWTQDSFPPWYRVVIWSGRLRSVTSPQLRIWGDPCWSATGELAVTAFDGIRRGIITVDPGNGATRWWSRPASASYRLLALAPGGAEALAVRCDRDGSAWLVRARPGGDDHSLRQLRPADQVPVRVLTWEHDGITLEGLLAAPAAARPHPLLVMLHGGPIGALACGEHPDPSAWAAAGYAVFMADFRGSGIAGHQLMLEAFARRWLPASDPEAGDVLTGVDTLTAASVADPRALFLLGYSYGGYLAGRIFTRNRRFRAAALCDAVADLRLLDPASQQMQARWLGGDPHQQPGRWAAASPAGHTGDIRTPVLLVYSAGGGLAAQGEAWQTALASAGAGHKLTILEGADHEFSSSTAQHRLFGEVTGWFDNPASPA